MDFKCGDLVCPNGRLTGEEVESKVVPPMIFLGVVDGEAKCFTFDKYGSMSGFLSIAPSSLHLLTREEAEEAYEFQIGVFASYNYLEPREQSAEVDVEGLMKILECAI